MKKAMILLTAVIAMFAITSCMDIFDDIFPEETVPVPVITDNDDIPTAGDNVYYLIKNCPENNAKLENGPETALNELIAAKLKVKNAWYPASPVMCKAMNAVEALVVELETHDKFIYSMGYVSDPDIWIVNCGVTEFLHYKF